LPAGKQNEIAKPSEFNISLTQAMIDVQQHVREIEQLPSCKRVASKVLVNSCVSYQPSNNDDRRSKEDTLEPFKNLFALQVTACELDDAEVSMPQACTPLLASAQGGDVSMECMSECLHNLYKTPSSWDSFNHAKTRAAIICHAMRSEIDQDEQLHLFRLLFNTVSSVVESVAMSDAELQKMRSTFHDIQASMRDFHVKVQSDNQELKDTVTAVWNDLESQLQLDIFKIADKIQSMIDTTREAEDRIALHSISVTRALDTTTEISAELDTQRREDNAKLFQDIEKIKSWFAFQTGLALDNLTQQVYGISKDLTMANELTSTMTASLRLSNTEADEQIVRMAEMKMRSNAFADAQEDLHVGSMRRYEEMAVKQSETLEFLQAVSGIAKLLRMPLDFVYGLFQGSTILRFVFYYSLTLGCILLYILSCGQASFVAFMTAASCCFGMIATRLHVRNSN
jgi:hypothetical protein